jgi:hypothetical protein
MGRRKSGAQQLSRRSQIKVKIDAKTRKRIIQISVDILSDASCTLHDKLLRLSPDGPGLALALLLERDQVSDDLGPALAGVFERDRELRYAAHNKDFVEHLNTEIVELEPNGNVSWSNGVQLITGLRGIKKAISKLRPSFAKGELPWPEFKARYAEGFPPLDLLYWAYIFDAKKTANKVSRIPRREAEMSHKKKATLKKV